MMALIDDHVRKQITATPQLKCLVKCIREDRVPCEIEEGLLLGSVGAAIYEDELKRLNITHILVVAKSIGRPVHPNDFVHKVIEVADREDVYIRQYFDECFEFIDEAKSRGGGVLVHCVMGRSRSVAIIVSYLMKKRGMSLSQALEHVKRRRQQASPNSGFVSQLEEFGPCYQNIGHE